VPIPANLAFEQAAIIPDAVSTSWAAITATAQVRPAEAAGAWGAGGLGAHAVQPLRLAAAGRLVLVGITGKPLTISDSETFSYLQQQVRGLERCLDGDHELRGFRVDDDVPAEQHAADDLPGVPGRVLRVRGHVSPPLR
jgi:hypothetical protein